MTEGPLIVVVDDDESVRESLHELLREFGFTVRSFASAEECLIDGRIGEACCLVSDIDMPGMSGCDLQQELRRRGETVPIVFISAHADDVLRSQVLEQGALACLCKPFSDIVLLETIRAALGGAVTGGRSDTGQ
ncbi:response regulator transcription factor [Paraburkholderia hospita]|jgi:FixJ family two-component response regulator|uniref:response regulator transcription factor n=1 Tax=Paraburkholderia hospita TaxID=169430 RepID=UPI0009A7E048|nr:response regulator [Paraburkholderia hospita]SKC99624.1 Response regulator receiver domain-containing protein [Paraburkholderia hospita]